MATQQQQQSTQQQPQQQQRQPVRQPDVKTQLKQLYDKSSIQFDDETIQLCPQIKILNNLVKYDNRIDQLIKSKRIELQESFIQPGQYLKKTLRIIVYSELVCDEWNLYIKGQVLSEDKKPFSYFIRQLEVQFDKTYYASQNVIQWNRNHLQQQKQQQETSGFHIKRKGPACDVLISIILQTYPQKYKLHKTLQQLLGIKEGTRSQILYCFWEYVKLNNLTDKENKDQIIADEQLKQLFGQERIPISNLNMLLKMFIENPEPIQIKHHLGVSNYIGFDVVVEQEMSFSPELMPFLAQKVVTEDNSEKKQQRAEHPFIQLNQKIKGFEKQIQKYLDQSKSHKLKRDAYYQYQKSPSLFLENLFLQQNSYLELMQNDEEMSNEDPKNMKFLMKNQELVERQIRKYLEQQQQPQQ
ncbi:unnamed protein product (macronuclear) [Paramecium tetraurelia]|uniref:DM2 domain-containing protein n=1 Tax=Paramecium tetraurelia TaxID=5888 RepID=A0CSW8_PARTE|nr:uncharacterized protein GSPATT00010157001 [Paramecium tetraurelia]CAK73885.1 unnamed protein product [Paramecium tetraurelia]|eukprot:XP_001441282.1 hypothetical protein (macronuclear) [Paramecium tetraurelia strain d4-2]